MAQGPINDQPQGPTQAEIAAIAICALWVVGVAVAFWLIPGEVAIGGLRVVVMLLTMFVPVALVGIALFVARIVQGLQAEVRHLHKTLAAMRQPVTAGQTTPAAPVQRPAAAATPFTSQRLPARPVAPRTATPLQVEQPALALAAGPDDDSPPLENPDLIRALNFPDNEDDTAGFAALRRALRDRTARHLVQASQDVLTLLSQDGIYMDDLRPDPASADLWRRFAKGERGQGVAAVGAVRDEAGLSVVTARMREDAVFRDAVHHFLRRFDLILVTFEQNATDADLRALAETRTARAFMLLARASRTFD